MEDYLIKKDNYKFNNILSDSYNFNEQFYILNKSNKADGSIKIVYAQYSTLKIGLKLGQLDGETLKNYLEHFEDGEYKVWNPATRNYKKYNFIVTKKSPKMICSKFGERYSEFDVVLEKSSEVI